MRIALLLTLVLAACGGSSKTGDDGDDGPGGSDATPSMIDGGGVKSAPLGGKLFVYAIDNQSGAAIANATVSVGTMSMTTDSTGLASFSDPSLTGTVSVTVAASGHAMATWVGVAGANATIPLQPSQSTVPTASASGSFSLPDPSSLSHYTLAVVLYTFLDDPSAPENSLTQQPNSDGTTKNMCIYTAVSGSSTCNWNLVARTGKQRHFALILDGNPNGTNDDPSDDTYDLVGYMVGDEVTLTSGQNMGGESLHSVSATKTIHITSPSLPSGYNHVQAIPELALGDAGRIVFPLPAIGASGTATVLDNSGDLAGDYAVVAITSPSATVSLPYSGDFPTMVGDSVTLAGWLPAPANLVGSGGTYTFSGADGAGFHSAQFTIGGNTVWTATVLDGSNSIALPAGVTTPLTGAATFEVDAADVGDFDSTHFDIPTVKAALVRASGASNSVTP
ncbi:MAG TPA: hypothetical protein VGM88_34640 [Kofleriaceae bacterium]|jgi:hypothetical protein